MCQRARNAHEYRERYGSRVSVSSQRGLVFPSRRGVDASTGHRHQISRQGFATKRDAVAALNVALADVDVLALKGNPEGSVNLRDYLAD